MPRKAKPQGRQRGTIEPRGINKWLVKVYVGTDAEGKRKYSSKIVNGTYKQAEQERTQLLRSLDTDEFVEPSKLTLREYIDQWLKGKSDLSARTAIDYDSRLNYVRESLGHLRLDKLSGLTIQGFYAELTTRGLSAVTVRGTHTILKQALEQAVAWRYIVRNPAEHCNLPKISKDEMQVFTKDQADLFLEAAKQDSLYAMWALFLATGLRTQEMFALKWSDITTRDGRTFVTVNRALKHIGKGKYIEGQPKTRRSRRTISIPQSAAGALTAHRKSQLEAILAAGDKYQRQDYIFASVVGTPLDLTNVRRRFHALCKKAEVPCIRLYDLRHTHATMLLGAGVNLKIVSERLGHSSIMLTGDTYSHVIPEIEQETAATVEALLFRTA